MDDPDVGSENMGIAGGMFFSFAEIGGFTGPLLTGLLVDATGTFVSGAACLAATGLVLFGLTFFLRKISS
jgi:cyanate permease